MKKKCQQICVVFFWQLDMAKSALDYSNEYINI